MFLLSLALIFISSYLFLSSVKSRKTDSEATTAAFFGFLYFVLIVFSQIILSFEMLSLLNSISKKGFLICNFIFVILSAILFFSGKRELYKPRIKEEFKKIIFCLKRDKLLLFCAISFVLFLIFELITVKYYPILFGDALNYYFSRALEWIQSGNLSHFVTQDSRETIMPINFDMLYMMHFLFTGSEKGTAIYAFVGYLTTIYVLYPFIKELGFSRRSAIWSVIVFSSFALTLLEAATPCSELSAGGLLLASVFLFYVNVKHNDTVALFFSALSLALALGVKTTSVMTFPVVLLLFTVILLSFKPKNKKKTIAYFTLFFITNFIIFSSFNYILNYLEYSNPISSKEQLLIHGFRGGFEGWLCNFIKYCFMIFDTSGINFGDFGGFIMHIQSLVLGIFGFKDTSFSSSYFPGYFDYNNKLSMQSAVLGATGLFAFLPALIKSIKHIRKNKKRLLTGALGISLILCICLLSRAMVFAQFNNRYIITFITLASPVLAYSYVRKKSFCKFFVCFLIFWYLAIVSPAKSIQLFVLLQQYGYKNFSSPIEKLIISEEAELYNAVVKQQSGKIALITSQLHTAVYYFEKPIFKGFTVKKVLAETLKENDLSEYDYILASKYNVTSNVVINQPYTGKTPAENCRYLDYNQNEINEYDKEYALTVVCEIPISYYEQNGFIKVYETKNFIIFKKMTDRMSGD